MPEGPSIVIAKELLQKFKRKKIISATGNAKINMDILANQKIISIRSWGKHLLICLPALTIRIHFLMFGSYSIDENTKQQRSIRLCLNFAKHKIYFYTCSVKLIEGNINDTYDWSSDIMNDDWDAKKALKKIKELDNEYICDVLLNQEIFAGVGNIIKNEVLYRVKIHPESIASKIPTRQLNLIIKEARNYSFDFLKWKKEFVLKKHWLAHTKKTCLRCDLPLIKKYCGTTKRRTFFCNKCQLLYK
ncbi:MAG: DNA-formamidopyrimidine glycosylase family protein [Bacteroidota bacterium]